MTTLLDRSLMRFKTAKRNILETTYDDAWCDGICFDLQQAIEFLIKWKLESIGVPYTKTHDIMVLCDLLYQNNIDIYQVPNLKERAAMITSWETSSRYGSGVLTTKTAIDEVVAIYNAMSDMLVPVPERVIPEALQKAIDVVHK